ncbi:hypothetical protein [Paraflavitalea speifideaquila]|uniref:hypothetical protein n=1 Tax=Paraflavitalea speifideaquila TaxID=3076558 RepID=UPI0028E81404|nr:hypothetical protein [Paraflavitalea speifideiaquila]
MQYENVRSAVDTSQQDKSAINRLLSGDHFSKSLALSMSYEDMVEDIGLSYRFYVKSIANGYQNPGNLYLPRGSKEAGIDFRKDLFKKVLRIGIRGDLREYKYNDELEKNGVIRILHWMPGGK